MDDDGWESRTESAALIGPDEHAGGSSQRLSRLGGLWTVAFAACLLAGAASLFWLWRDAQAGLELVRNELNGAIALEIWADERGDRVMAVGLLDESASPTWRNQLFSRFYPPTESSPHQITINIQEFDLDESRALVEVLVSDSRLPTPYQKTRTYRETNTGWIRTAPGADFWGAWESQESAYFSFRNASGRMLAVHSPYLLPRPLGVSVETVLTESVILQLVNLVVWERMGQLPDDWQSIRSGLRLWLIWKMDGLLAQSRTEIVRWLYEESVAGWGRGQTQRPGNYAEICQSFWL